MSFSHIPKILQHLTFKFHSDDEDLIKYSDEAAQSSTGTSNLYERQTGTPSSSGTVISNLDGRQTGAGSLTSSSTSSLYGSSSTDQTHVGAEASTSHHDYDYDERLMKEKLTEMFPSIDIKVIEEAVHDSIELEEAVDILLHCDDEKSGKFEHCNCTTCACMQSHFKFGRVNPFLLIFISQNYTMQICAAPRIWFLSCDFGPKVNLGVVLS